MASATVFYTYHYSRGSASFGPAFDLDRVSACRIGGRDFGQSFRQLCVRPRHFLSPVLAGTWTQAWRGGSSLVDEELDCIPGIRICRYRSSRSADLRSPPRKAFA